MTLNAVLKANKPNARFFSRLTPAEAGRRAEAVAAALPESGSLSFASKLAHAGISHEHNAPMAPPIHLATTYTRPSDGTYLDTDLVYSRYDNPTRVALEKAVFGLETFGLNVSDEQKPTTYAFASGMMAATAVVLSHKTPLTIILPEDHYHGVGVLMSKIFGRHNVSVQRANFMSIPSILEEVSKADPDNEVIVWMETPSNPKIDVIDIAAVCNAVKNVTSHTISTVVDNTMASPVVTRPLELGADFVLHSGTKYIAGHSDALLGILTVSPITERGKELVPFLETLQRTGGGVASPFDSWLAMRGLRTLQVRVEKQSKNAQALAEYFYQHELIKNVAYPGLPSHPQHEIAKNQMTLFGGVMSVELEDEAMAMAFAAALKTFQRATSLGGTETLIEHRASIEPPDRQVSPPGLLRISVGLEDVADLIHDVEQALGIAKQVVMDA